MAEPLVLRAGDPFPEKVTRSLALLGGEWAHDAISWLTAHAYDGHVFLVGPHADDAWSADALRRADLVVAWLGAPSLVDGARLGAQLHGHKLEVGRPDAPGLTVLDAAYRREGGREPHASLDALMTGALARLGAGAARTGGEVHVPLHVWNTPMFQAWYGAQVAAGNRLDGADVKWVFFLPRVGKTFAFVLQVDVWVAAESRNKSNEWIVSRADLCSTVLYPATVAPRNLDSLYDTELVLVREFRSTARTADGYVREVPGGSSVKPNQPPEVVAAAEVQKETGLDLAPARWTGLGSRQVAGTLSTHHAVVYAVALSPEEMALARRFASEQTLHGDATETEQTYIEIATYRDLLTRPDVDWATLGMVSRALLGDGVTRA